MTAQFFPLVPAGHVQIRQVLDLPLLHLQLSRRSIHFSDSIESMVRNVNSAQNAAVSNTIYRLTIIVWFTNMPPRAAALSASLFGVIISISVLVSGKMLMIDFRGSILRNRRRMTKKEENVATQFIFHPSILMFN